MQSLRWARKRDAANKNIVYDGSAELFSSEIKECNCLYIPRLKCVGWQWTNGGNQGVDVERKHKRDLQLRTEHNHGRDLCVAYGDRQVRPLYLVE